MVTAQVAMLEAASKECLGVMSRCMHMFQNLVLHSVPSCVPSCVPEHSMTVPEAFPLAACHWAQVAGSSWIVWVDMVAVLVRAHVPNWHAVEFRRVLKRLPELLS